ncbi:MAG: hypothetical protein QOE51_739 [Actinoplanes sp.]|jgi:hypothetical protein|nr:hypothetical protein [Actinoplanes sp.]
MSPDQQPSRADPPPIEIGSVVEFGVDPPPARRWRGLRFSITAWAHGLADDRRVVPLTAVLGGFALFASLISEWQVTDVDATVLGEGQVGTRPLVTTIADLGAWGGGYLIGLFGLVAATVLVLFGPAPGRSYARLAGLSTAGVLAGLLAAVGSELGDTSRPLGQIFMVGLNDDQFTISYGRGLWCAVFGVAALAATLFLAGRHLLPPERDETVAAGEDVPVAAVPTVWSWRRPQPEGDEKRPVAEPFDLTVSSAKPFTPSADDRGEGTST